MIEAADYGDVVDGKKVGFLDQPGNRVRGQFFYDEEHDTFTFQGQEAILEGLPGGEGAISAWALEDFNSLVDFHDQTRDIVWLRPNEQGDLVYQGGTGYGANGASVQKSDLGWALLHDIGAIGGYATAVGVLVVDPEPFTKVGGIVGGLSVGVIESVNAYNSGIGFRRSLSASYRRNMNER